MTEQAAVRSPITRIAVRPQRADISLAASGDLPSPRMRDRCEPTRYAREGSVRPGSVATLRFEVSRAQGCA